MQTNSTIKSRLAEFLKHIGVGQAKFAENVGLSKGFANNVGDSIRADNLTKISAIYPELNTVWLLTGAGQMLNTPSQEGISPTKQAGEISIPQEAWAIIRDQAASLKAKDEQMNKVIAMLEEQLNKKGEGVGNARAAVG